MHSIVYSDWKKDQDGRERRDSAGHRIRDKRGGKKKSSKDITTAERESQEHQQANFDRIKQRQSEALLVAQAEARRHISDQ